MQRVDLIQKRQQDALRLLLIEALARVLLLEIQAFFENEDGQREYAEWKAKQQAEQKNKV